MSFPLRLTQPSVLQNGNCVQSVLNGTETLFRQLLHDKTGGKVDHLFYNDYFFAHRAYTLNDSAGSDHFPIVAEFS